jgi:hypothetical protein
MMAPRARMARSAARATVVLAVIAVLAGCGSSPKRSESEESSRTGSCPRTVLAALRHVAKRVYHEGVSSERTEVALRAAETSIPLRTAVERGDAAGTRAAAQAMVASGRMTNLHVESRGQVLADVGAPHAVAPLSGMLTGASGSQIGTFVTSVWSDEGLLAETDGVIQGATVLRAGRHDVAGSFALPHRELATHGTLTLKGVDYQYTSYLGKSYPSGSALRVYLLKPLGSTMALCGATQQDTVVNTLSRIATLIYRGERGRRTLAQVRRVQADAGLLAAVSRRDPAATRQAIERLLNQHIVRMRVSVPGRLLSDVGGPYVLAPVSAPLRLGGRTIGRFVLSIQDDEGYLRLAQRLAGLDVLMYMGSQLVKNSLGPAPGAVPASGRFRYRGRAFRTFTLNAEAFPSGPLRITALVGIPYL